MPNSLVVHPQLMVLWLRMTVWETQALLLLHTTWAAHSLTKLAITSICITLSKVDVQV
jgi:hypothetical protein